VKTPSPPAVSVDMAAASISTASARLSPEYWDIRDIQFHLRIGRTFAWQLVKADGFPPPLVLGRRRMCWLAADVRSYAATRRDAERHRPAVRRTERGPSYVVRSPRRRR
jgi:predicted DNA-binding transcriptional regulator AlpA